MFPKLDNHNEKQFEFHTNSDLNRKPVWSAENSTTAPLLLNTVHSRLFDREPQPSRTTSYERAVEKANDSKGNHSILDKNKGKIKRVEKK